MNNIKKQILSFCFTLAIIVPGVAQQKYWITFTDKDTDNYNYAEFLSPQAIQNRTLHNIPLYQYSDIPLKTRYLDSLSRMGLTIQAHSRWFNSVTAMLEKEDLEKLKRISFIKSVDPVNTAIKVNSLNTDLDAKSYSLTSEQMVAKSFSEAGLSGKGVNIGIIDAGFYHADREPRLIHLFDESKIKMQRDFIDSGRTDLVTTKMTDADDHGKKVLEYLCGYYISEKFQSGLAVNGTFYLARTENGDKEHRAEEDD
jgi:hypothetical protein